MNLAPVRRGRSSGGSFEIGSNGTGAPRDSPSGWDLTRRTRTRLDATSGSADKEDEADALRSVGIRRGFEGLPWDEIAKALDIGLSTAEARMARAKERLRVLLGPTHDSDDVRERTKHDLS